LSKVSIFCCILFIGCIGVAAETSVFGIKLNKVFENKYNGIVLSIEVNMEREIARLSFSADDRLSRKELIFSIYGSPFSPKIIATGKYLLVGIEDKLVIFQVDSAETRIRYGILEAMMFFYADIVYVEAAYQEITGYGINLKTGVIGDVYTGKRPFDISKAIVADIPITLY